ncbi:MAG: multiheme c-type cytochrome, partial [Bryobacteraceae bacterium]
PGLLYKTLDPQAGILGCFECHSTGPVRDTQSGLEPGESGVQCEACHGAASAHVASAGKQKLSIPRADLNNFCGRCHRPPASDPASIDWSFAWNVRHQPVYLSQSQCFKKSGGALTCLTCHDAHAPRLARDACAGCHASTPRACGPRCVNCHMPAVSPEPPLRFTNHWIGVYSGGAKLRPR